MIVEWKNLKESAESTYLKRDLWKFLAIKLLKENNFLQAKTNLLENNNGKIILFTIVTRNKLGQK